MSFVVGAVDGIAEIVPPIYGMAQLNQVHPHGAIVNLARTGVPPFNVVQIVYGIRGFTRGLREFLCAAGGFPPACRPLLGGGVRRLDTLGIFVNVSCELGSAVIEPFGRLRGVIHASRSALDAAVVVFDFNPAVCPAEVVIRHQ
jgi:hypothetical protein